MLGRAIKKRAFLFRVFWGWQLVDSSMISSSTLSNYANTCKGEIMKAHGFIIKYKNRTQKKKFLDLVCPIKLGTTIRDLENLGFFILKIKKVKI